MVCRVQPSSADFRVKSEAEPRLGVEKLGKGAFWRAGEPLTARCGARTQLPQGPQGSIGPTGPFGGGLEWPQAPHGPLGPFWGGIGMETGATGPLGPLGRDWYGRTRPGAGLEWPHRYRALGPVDRAQGPGPVDRAQGPGPVDRAQGVDH